MEDFPRGGANALTPLEVRKIKETATQDVLFGVRTLSLLYELTTVDSSTALPFNACQQNSEQEIKET